MAWTVILESEDKTPLFYLSSEFTIRNGNNNPFRLLKYLDPFGDAIFNYLQMDDLIEDLHLLKEEDCVIVKELVSLAEKCKQERHTYLVFYGD